MSKGNLEWRELKGATFIFCLCLAISVVVIGFTYYFRMEMESDFNINKSQFNSISSRYLAVDQEEGYIRDYYPQYMKLYNRGVIGREHRLNWIEVLRATGREIKLNSLDYSIGSQIEHTSEFPITAGNFKIYSSSMDLRLKLLHEGDLLRLIQRLDQKALGLYSIKECKFSRERPEVTPDINMSNIFADCQLNWYSIKKADGTDLETS